MVVLNNQQNFFCQVFSSTQAIDMPYDPHNTEPL